ncbi:CRISPR-associated protein Csy1 [Pseudoalteromonas haloplanktis]|uniref:CRISPR-associated protein Csy1 n=1 Tax=Pseudoalteromonas haloplanktis TaxID=228 RepID=A0A9W4W0Z6_PSEHA|nr:type I-F CRISPR-associated protein Csy1 [Pseudoalteromonas haloplanktis]CAH9050934.1 CRISPR-associated protein Csy1 [Pseudoalteromonas haloplanktis]|tara:strand:- start:4878 stop:6134 length:1257 start_codon:yes stop_codon:yes gene_type:complete
MPDPAIQNYFSERKEAWMKKNLNTAMQEHEVKELEQLCEQQFSLNEWLPNAAKRAGQISMSTHPCTFSHPSARKNKNGYVSSVLAEIDRVEDGYLKTGNVSVATDALGNAAALDVYKFLTLTMQNGENLLTHILQETELAKALLTIKTANYQELRSGFLAMVEGAAESITSSKIKQVYFPVDDDYHQLSLLTNSGMVYQLRSRLDKLRFSDEVKELRDKKRKNEFSEQGFSEIYGLTTIGYGGTKPQNISVLNNQNGGKAHLLSSLPPSIEKRSIHFPRSDFFTESFKKYEYADNFKALHKLFQTDYNNIKLRDARDRNLQQIINLLIEKMWAVRAVSQAQYHAETSSLSSVQLTWLHDDFADEREKSAQWLNLLITEISTWLTRSYEKVLDKKAIKLGDAERLHFAEVIERNREFLK